MGGREAAFASRKSACLALRAVDALRTKKYVVDTLLMYWDISGLSRNAIFLLNDLDNPDTCTAKLEYFDSF